MPTLGSYIRTLRIKNSLTQSSLAGKLHVTDKAVSKWERDLSYPDISLLPKLAGILGVSVSDLLREWDDNGSPEQLKNYYRMSHDVRTPLHIILGCADLAGQYADDPVRRKKYLDAIRISATYLLDRYSQIRKDIVSDPEELSEYYRTHEGKAQHPVYDFHGKRILIVEDMELSREIAREIVIHAGAEADCAAGGEECLKKIMDSPAGTYDLILMDIVMPDMDGIETVRRIRNLNDPSKSAIPVIAITADVSESMKEKAFAAGMNGFAAKPAGPEQLYETIKANLR